MGVILCWVEMSSRPRGFVGKAIVYVIGNVTSTDK